MSDGAGIIVVDGGVGFTVAAVVRPQRPLARDLLCRHQGRPPHGDILGAVYCLTAMRALLLPGMVAQVSFLSWAALQSKTIFFRERYHAYI